MVQTLKLWLGSIHTIIPTITITIIRMKPPRKRINKNYLKPSKKLSYNMKIDKKENKY